MKFFIFDYLAMQYSDFWVIIHRIKLKQGMIKSD